MRVFMYCAQVQAGCIPQHKHSASTPRVQQTPALLPRKRTQPTGERPLLFATRGVDLGGAILASGPAINLTTAHMHMHAWVPTHLVRALQPPVEQ